MERPSYRLDRIEFERGTAGDERTFAVLNRLGREDRRAAKLQAKPRVATNEAGL